jgi:hypothetical protein
MSSNIILKKSSVVSKVPVAGDLVFGELALNYSDGKLYYKKSDGTTIDSFNAGGGSGDVTLTGTQTLTNKRITPRIISISSASTITPTGDTADQYIVTAQAASATIAAPSGTPTDGQRLILRIEDNGTAQALTWTTGSGAYRAVGVTLPTTTVASKSLYVGAIYNSQDVFWDVLAVAILA